MSPPFFSLYLHASGKFLECQIYFHSPHHFFYTDTTLDTTGNLFLHNIQSFCDYCSHGGYSSSLIHAKSFYIPSPLL